MSVDRTQSSDDGPKVEVQASDAKKFTFMLTVSGSDGKKKAKHYFKTSTAEEMQLWIKCINKFTKNIREGMV